jgi:hypothetical protein
MNQPHTQTNEVARQLWEAFKVASETLNQPPQ